MGPAEEVSADEIAHLRYRPTGFDERIGISPVLMASGTVDLLLSNRRAVRATMQNAARPSAYLRTDQKIDPARAEAIKDRWNSIHGGDGRGGTAILEEGLDYKTVPLNDLQELAANETSRMGVGDVARLFGIPPALLLGTEQNRATATEDRRRLLAFAVAPLARLAEDALAQALLSEEQRHEGFGVRLDTSVETLGQGSELGAALASLLNSGALSINEARSRLGLSSVADGDLLRAPANTWPLPAWATAVPRSADTTAAGDDSGARALRLLARSWEAADAG